MTPLQSNRRSGPPAGRQHDAMLDHADRGRAVVVPHQRVEVRHMHQVRARGGELFVFADADIETALEEARKVQ